MSPMRKDPFAKKPVVSFFDRFRPSRAVSPSVPVSAVVPGQAVARTSRRRSDTGVRQTRCRREWQPASLRWVYELVVGRDRQREKKGVSSSVRRGGFEPRRKIEKQREVPQMETNERAKRELYQAAEKE